MTDKELTDEEYIKAANENYEEAWETLNSTDGWTVVKTDSLGAVIEAKKGNHVRKMFRVKCRIPVAPKKYISYLRDKEKYTEWNTTFSNFDILKRINDNVFICRQVTSGIGPVSKREFIVVLKEDFKGKDFFMAGASTQYPYKESSDCVRGIGYPTGQLVREVPDNPEVCDYVWLLECDLKGWLPTAIVDSATPTEMMKGIECGRKLAKR